VNDIFVRRDRLSSLNRKSLNSRMMEFSVRPRGEMARVKGIRLKKIKEESRRFLKEELTGWNNLEEESDWRGMEGL
jgi:uncharacterized UPF0160 family protein